MSQIINENTPMDQNLSFSTAYFAFTQGDLAYFYRYACRGR